MAQAEFFDAAYAPSTVQIAGSAQTQGGAVIARKILNLRRTGVFCAKLFSERIV